MVLSSFVVHGGARVEGLTDVGRPKGEGQAVRLSVTFHGGDHATIQKLAADLHLSTAWLVRRAVSEFVARHSRAIEPELPLRRSVESSDGPVRTGLNDG